MNQLPEHPLQSDAWATFRSKMGTTTITDIPGYHMTIHPLPILPYTIGYIPKCPLPDTKTLTKLKEIGAKHKCMFIKLEPNAIKKHAQFDSEKLGLVTSSHPLFTTYTFHMDLTPSADQLLRTMKSKSRYNIRVAQKHGVTVKEDNSDNAFESYIALSKQTWQRKRFVAHGEEYHRTMWNIMKKAHIAHLLIAEYKKTPLTAWIMFLYKDVLYYPYGASSSKHRNVMASNLMMWEAINWGKKHNAKLFDMWGALGPEPEKSHPWYGFHRFKQGYGAKLTELVGSYDLVLNPTLYSLYTIVHPIREKLLGL